MLYKVDHNNIYGGYSINKKKGINKTALRIVLASVQRSLRRIRYTATNYQQKISKLKKLHLWDQSSLDCESRARFRSSALFHLTTRQHKVKSVFICHTEMRVQLSVLDVENQTTNDREIILQCDGAIGQYGVVHPGHEEKK